LVRAIFLIHRYMGIAIGVLMAVWCLSGVVMMYVPYPQLTEELRTGGLAPVEWKNCCALDAVDIAPDAAVGRFQLESLGERAVLRVTPDVGPLRLIDLATGARIEAVTAAEAVSVAQRFSYSLGVSARPAPLGEVERDQWTVAAAARERPFHLFAVNDERNTRLYVSSVSGRAAQVTDGPQRFWNWLGSVPHWIYPTVLRQNAALWSQVVIWTSLVGTFLAATGIYLGIRQFSKQRNGRWASPYRGFMYWHHVPGLIFGVFALTWVLSGLLSMNPWGLLETQGISEDVRALRGDSPRWSEVRSLVESMAENMPPDVVSLSEAPFGGQLFAVAVKRDGTRHRLDAMGNEHPLDESALTDAAHRLGARGDARGWELVTHEDDYNYSVGRSEATLPVLRVRAGAEDSTVYYLDPVSGRLLNKIDAGGRAYRWWHSGLHQLDFTAGMRTSAFRNFLMLPLLLGAALVASTGAWLGIRRLTR
jgi:uncharacterized iron-regulated membrane protein